MAITTVSSPIRKVDTNTYTMFGYPVPPNVIAVDIRDDLMNDMKVVRWRVRSDISDEIHTMDLPHVTEENILAVLAAMRLTC
jgi:hypothetical protein